MLSSLLRFLLFNADFRIDLPPSDRQSRNTLHLVATRIGSFCINLYFFFQFFCFFTFRLNCRCTAERCFVVLLPVKGTDVNEYKNIVGVCVCRKIFNTYYLFFATYTLKTTQLTCQLAIFCISVDICFRLCHPKPPKGKKNRIQIEE